MSSTPGRPSHTPSKGKRRMSVGTPGNRPAATMLEGKAASRAFKSMLTAAPGGEVAALKKQHQAELGKVRPRSPATLRHPPRIA